MSKRLFIGALGALVLVASLSSSSCSSFLADAQTAERFVSAAAALAPTVIDEVQSHLVTACRKAGVDASHAAQDAQKAIGGPNEKTTAAASATAQARMVKVCTVAGVTPTPTPVLTTSAAPPDLGPSPDATHPSPIHADAGVRG